VNWLHSVVARVPQLEDQNWGDLVGHIYSFWFQDVEHTEFYPILMRNRNKFASLEIYRKGDKLGFHQRL
jgi:hypothetical protein